MSSPAPYKSSEVIVDPGVHHGEPVIAGTATTVRAIAELWNQGMAAEEIPIHLPHLGLHQVFAALSYYLTNRSEIDDQIKANQIPEDWSGKQFDPSKAAGT